MLSVCYWLWEKFRRVNNCYYARVVERLFTCGFLRPQCLLWTNENCKPRKILVPDVRRSTSACFTQNVLVTCKISECVARCGFRWNSNSWFTFILREIWSKLVPIQKKQTNFLRLFHNPWRILQCYGMLAGRFDSIYASVVDELLF